MVHPTRAGLTVVLLTVCFVTACVALAVDGSRNVVQEARMVPRFHSVDLSGIGDVLIRQGTPQEVVVETDDNLIQHVATEVNNGVLVISNDTDIKRVTALTIHVTAEELGRISVSGAGDVIAEETLRSDQLDLQVSGAGSVRLWVEAQQVEASISGAGNVVLEGDADVLIVEISGAGDLDGFGLRAKAADVEVSGAGDCTVTVLESLEASVSGAGDVRYRGTPDVRSSISGVGDVVPDEK